MHQKDNDEKKPAIDPPCTTIGIPRRTFLKGMLATGAMTSLSALGVVDLRWAEAAGSAGERNLYQKIIAAHLGSGEMKAGSEIGLICDSTLTQDGLGVMSYLQYEAIGIPQVKTKLSVSYVDHQMLQDGFENADDHRYLESVTDKYGILHSRPGNGICHQLHLERFSRPGWTLLGGDSHTPTCGAVGMLAMGAGGLDVAVVMGGGQFYLSYPKVLRINLNNRLRPWVSAKDIILEVLRTITTKGNVGWAIEYSGTGMEHLTVPERGVIANMGAEAGVTTSIFPSDEVTLRFFKAQQRESQWLELKPDAGAQYDKTIDIDLSAIEPNVALPHSPDNVKRVREVQPIKVDQVCIGSCTNSSYYDLMVVAGMLKGRKVHPELSVAIAPGSRQVLEMITANGALQTMITAGCRIMEAACGFCVGAGQAPPSGGVSVRTSNRNYKGRSGTADANIYLTSPETAVATALTGVLTDPVTLGMVYPRVELPASYTIDDSMIAKPTGKKEVRRGPNIGTPPSNTPMPAELKAKVAIKVGDKITTDHIAPSGTANKYRSNIPKYSTFIFRNVDEKFPERCAAIKKEGLASAIVAGVSYGQGSSREHAALCPMYLGVRTVIAKSIERIHLDNLVNFGIVPLTFAEATDYDKIKDGDVIVVEDIQEVLTREVKAVRLKNVTQGTTYAVNCGVQERQRAIIKAGGLLNYTRTGGKAWGRETHMDLNTLIRECATSEGADFFGVADVVPAREAIREQGGDLVASFPRAVSLGMKLFHPIVDQIPQRFEDTVHMQNYGHHCYTVINQRLDLIASKVAHLLQKQGHRAYPVPASQTLNTARNLGVFSNKMAAHMAGLGWIGKSCLLVTPEIGPRCRWATVLTDAPLAVTGQPMDTRCGECRECVDACPAQAFTGRNFREDEHRDVRFDTQKCKDYRAQCREQHGVNECGVCLWACPHGRKASQKLSTG